MDRKLKNVIVALTIVGVGSGVTLRKMVGFWRPWRKKRRLRKNGKKCPWSVRNPQMSLPLPSLTYLSLQSAPLGLSLFVLKLKKTLILEQP